MEITVSGKGVDIGQAFREYVTTKIDEHVTKYTDRITNLDVIAAKESYRFQISIHGNMGTHSHMVVKSYAEAGDIHAAFDDALQKIEKQLRRYKSKIKNHHNTSVLDLPYAEATQYILSPDAGEKEGDGNASGVIIAEQPENISTLTVSEAVMRMDLENTAAMMFYNAANGRLNVVYRREDGNITWLDPKEQAVKKAS